MKKGTERIIFPLDVASADSAVELAAKVKDVVGIFKIGLELFIRSGPEGVRRIQEATGAGIFLDLKLHDIPETVRRAMAGAADLEVDFVTVHCGESRKMLEAAVDGSGGRTRVLGVTVLTSVAESDLRAAGFSASLTDLVRHRAQAAQAAGCAGIVCSAHEAAEIKSVFGGSLLAVTPGIRPAWEGVAANDQKRVMTPSQAIRNGADYLVVGRPIRDADDPGAAARRIGAEIEAALQADRR